VPALLYQRHNLQAFAQRSPACRNHRSCTIKRHLVHSCLVQVVQPLDPRIHFALVCGAKSCPPIKLYSAATLEEGLAAAADTFCASDVEVDAAAKKVRVICCAGSAACFVPAADFAVHACCCQLLLVAALPAPPNTAWHSLHYCCSTYAYVRTRAKHRMHRHLTARHPPAC
jgi:hypothetical protein